MFGPEPFTLTSFQKLKQAEKELETARASAQQSNLNLLNSRTELAQAQRELDDFRTQVLGADWRDPRESELRLENDALKAAKHELEVSVMFIYRSGKMGLLMNWVF